MSQLTQQIHELFAQVLHLTDAFDDDTPFIELGGQSILMGELKSRMEQMFQVDIPFDVMFAQGTVSGLARQVEKSRNNVITGSRDADFSVDPACRFQPCPMTDLQTAYYIGRQADTELGGSPTRGYSEIICTEYDQERMTQAIRKLFQKHDVLRCCFQPDGTQQTVPEYDPPAPELEDISHMPPAEQEAYLLQKRERIFNTLFDVHQLPLVSFSATRCSGKTVIHFNHDGMIIDGWSHEKLIDELDQFYSDPERPVTPPGICFPDYVRYLEQLPGTEQFQADKAYWMEQAHSMYPRPSLPLLREPSQIKQVHTRQVIRYISQPVWDSVTGFAARHGLTPFAVLFTAFGKSILKYCKDDRCLINMPVAVRPQIHPEIGELIGECSNFFLFGFDAMPDSSFVECAARNQQKIAQIMQHNAFFGTDYIRALQKTEGASVAAPIVFTSLIDVPRRREISLKKTYTKTHTSQVWIDAIAMRNKEGIMLTMDCAADLFEESLTDSIGDTFAETLETIHLDPERLTAHAFIGLTHKEQAAIRDCTHADPQGNMPLLSELLLEAYRRYPEHAACIAGGNTRTYAEVFSTADSIAKQLLPLLSGSNSCQTAVFLEKGAQQLYAALACTMCNCAYFPLDIQMPELSGLEFSRILNADTRVIFTTAFDQYAVDSYRVNALDYLLKPISYPDFLASANKALRWYELLRKPVSSEEKEGSAPIAEKGGMESIFVKSEYKLLQIELRKILYIEGLKDYVKIFVEDEPRPVLSLMSMKSLEDMLPSDRFVRVHRSFIVQPEKIKVIERNRIVFGKEYIPISDNYKQHFLEMIERRSILPK